MNKPRIDTGARRAGMDKLIAGSNEHRASPVVLEHTCVACGNPAETLWCRRVGCRVMQDLMYGRLNNDFICSAPVEWLNKAADLAKRYATDPERVVKLMMRQAEVMGTILIPSAPAKPRPFVPKPKFTEEEIKNMTEYKFHRICKGHKDHICNEKIDTNCPIKYRCDPCQAAYKQENPRPVKPKKVKAPKAPKPPEADKIVSAPINSAALMEERWEKQRIEREEREKAMMHHAVFSISNPGDAEHIAAAVSAMVLAGMGGEKRKVSITVERVK